MDSSRHTPWVLAALLALAPCAKAAAPAPGEWVFEAALNLWLPAVTGSTRFEQPGGGGGGGSDIGVSNDGITGNLHFAFLGSFEARRDRWGLLTDLVYVDFQDSRSGYRQFTVGGVPLPVDASADVHTGLRGWEWTLAGTWDAYRDARTVLTLLGGARVLDIRQSLEWNLQGNVGTVPLPDQAGSLRTGVKNLDAIAGVKGRWSFGPGGDWFVPFYGDVGTGESALTWQLQAGLGHAWSWGDVIASWRVVGYDMKSGSTIENITFNGPSVAVLLRW
jgi:hypothetical protein